MKFTIRFFKLILCSIENTYKNNDQTTLKIDDANKASLRSFDTEQLRRETGKGKKKMVY